MSNSEIISLIIEEDNANERLDKVLSVLYPDFSRTKIQKMIKDGNVLVNDKIVKPSLELESGDIITFIIPENEEMNIVAENIPLNIVYEDEDLVVINKEQGMVVHPAAGHYHGTLVNAIMYHFKQLSSVNGALRPGIVHRLDKDTSGLIVVCKNDAAHKSLAMQLKDKTCSRKYDALVHGVVLHNNFKIDAPIGRHPSLRQKMTVISNGKVAVTNCKVLTRFNDFTLLECSLETGRTHQIRVHLDYIKYPVAGDRLYGPTLTIKGEGQYLHAKELSFIHPRTNQLVTFNAKTPDYFEKVLNELNQTGITEVVKYEK